MRPDDIARDLGLDFKTEEPAQSTMKVLRFTFKFPDMSAEPEAYAETVAKVTRWSERVKQWTFVQPGPLPIVAAEMTFGNRWRVALVNRKSRKLLKAFWSDEAQARRLAMSQATPMQGVKVLEETPMKEKETRKLRDSLAKAAEILAQPQAIPDLAPAPTLAPMPQVFGSNQGTGEAIH